MSIKNVATIILIYFGNTSYGQVQIEIINNARLLGRDTINQTIMGVKEGVWIEYDSYVRTISCWGPHAGQTESMYYYNAIGLYENGFKVGLWYSYYPPTRMEILNSRKKKITKLKDVLKGSLYQSETFFLGKKHGLETTYDQIGNVYTQRKYEKGSLIDSKQYFADGTIKYVAHFNGIIIDNFKIYYPDGRIKIQGTSVDLNTFEIEELNCYNTNGNINPCTYILFHEILMIENLDDF